jgi:hypothetical protein
MRAIDTLVPYERNARTHTVQQIAQLAASIREFGWTNPILIDADGGVLAGHGRLQAAKHLGMTEVPVIELAALTKVQRRAYILADNRLAEVAGWDVELQQLEVAELLGEGFDLNLIGYTSDEAQLIANGWASDINPVQRHGQTLTGIADQLRVFVDKGKAEDARKAITMALDAAGLTYEIA